MTGSGQKRRGTFVRYRGRTDDLKPGVAACGVMTTVAGEDSQSLASGAGWIENPPWGALAAFNAGAEVRRAICHIRVRRPNGHNPAYLHEHAPAAEEPQ